MDNLKCQFYSGTKHFREPGNNNILIDRNLKYSFECETDPPDFMNLKFHILSSILFQRLSSFPENKENWSHTTNNTLVLEIMEKPVKLVH